MFLSKTNFLICPQNVWRASMPLASCGIRVRLNGKRGSSIYKRLRMSVGTAGCHKSM